MKKRKWALSLLLLVLLTSALFPGVALAGDVFVDTWAELDNALSGVTTNPGDAIHVQRDITLQNDITLTNLRLIIQQYVSITTGSYSITQNYSSISNNTLENNGTIDVSNGGSIIIGSNCRLDNRHSGTINNGGTITNNGTIDNSGTITGNPIAGTAPPNITTTSPLPNGTANAAYSQALAADNSPTAWSLAIGSLPGGLGLSGNTISGTPSTLGTFTFSMKAEGAGGSHTKQFSITVIDKPGAPTNVTAIAGNGQATISFTAPTNNGGSPITSYTVTCVEDGSKTATGASGPLIVTGLTNGTAYTFTVTATNGAGTGAASTASNSVTPMVPPAAPTLTSANSYACTVGMGGAFQVTATGNPGTFTYSLTGQPTGVSIHSSSGLITVANTLAEGTYNFTIGADNGVNPPASQAFALTVRRPASPLPQTGDNSPVALWITLLGIGICAFILLRGKGKRKN